LLILIETLGVVQLVVKVLLLFVDPLFSKKVTEADADPPAIVVEVDLIYPVAFVLNVCVQSTPPAGVTDGPDVVKSESVSCTFPET